MGRGCQRIEESPKFLQLGAAPRRPADCLNRSVVGQLIRNQQTPVRFWVEALGDEHVEQGRIRAGSTSHYLSGASLGN